MTGGALFARPLEGGLAQLTLITAKPIPGLGYDACCEGQNLGGVGLFACDQAYPMTLACIGPHPDRYREAINAAHGWKSLQQFTDDAAAFEKHTWETVALATNYAKHVRTNFYGPNVADLELIMSVIRFNRI